MRSSRLMMFVLCVVAVGGPELASAQAREVARRYVGVLGTHVSLEMTLIFSGEGARGAGETFKGELRVADSAAVWGIAGRRDGTRIELRATGPADAGLDGGVLVDGVLRGSWRSAEGSMPLFAEEVSNDLDGGRSLNGHYVRQDKASGGAIDLLLLEAGRVKVQGYASWGSTAGAAAGEVAGYAVFDGAAARMTVDGCELVFQPTPGGLQVSHAGGCPGAFSGRYERRDEIVPDWETFHWVMGPQ